ncbi:MAG: F0F1 ATP synthase subunit A [Alistipes sp.]|nr:F0F1 ATP synthase subunit A [Alistipes sp.]
MLKRIYPIRLLLLLLLMLPLSARADLREKAEQDVNVKKIVLEHIGNSYEWHLSSWGGRHIAIPLPVILYSQHSGWHLFSSARLHHGEEAYNGFRISFEGDNSGKIVEVLPSGEEVRPWDFSLTKTVVGLWINSAVLLLLILGVARGYRKREIRGDRSAPKGLSGLIEMLIESLLEEVIRPCIGKNYRRFAPYLLTVFFFIFVNNLMGLVPFFPGGANVTGNITITLVLAVATFLAVNLFGTKAYWQEILWPEVPVWLKAPLPIMPAIEIIGLFTKPFALMIRLFANIMAGHAVILILTCKIFVTVKMGVAVNSSMTVVALLLSIFMNCLELLVAYLQAYVFTMLSAVFIGLAQAEHEHPHPAKNEQTIDYSLTDKN